MKIFSAVGNNKMVGSNYDENIKHLEERFSPEYRYHTQSYKTFSPTIAAVKFMKQRYPKENFKLYLFANEYIKDRAEMIKYAVCKKGIMPIEDIRILLLNSVENDQFEPMARHLDDHIHDGDKVLFEITHGTKNMMPYYISLFSGLIERKNVELIDMIYAPVKLNAEREVDEGTQSHILSYLDLSHQDQWNKACATFSETLQAQPILKLYDQILIDDKSIKVDDSLEKIFGILKDINRDLTVIRHNSLTSRVKEFLCEYEKINSSQFNRHNVMRYQSLESIYRSFLEFKDKSDLYIEKHMPSFLYNKNRIGEAVIFAYEKILDRMAEKFELYNVDSPLSKSSGNERYNTNQKIKRALKKDKNEKALYKKIEKVSPKIFNYSKDIEDLSKIRNNPAHGYYDEKHDIEAMFFKQNAGVQKHLSRVKEMYDILFSDIK